MEDQVKQITELFAAPRGELQLVTVWGGVKIYTSKKLKESFIKALAKSSRTAPIAGAVLKLMNDKEFYPCYLTNSVMKSILRFQPPQFKGYAGVTIGKIILVFVEAETNIFGFASNNEISVTTLHELIHRTSNDFKNQFFNTFKKELVEYYSDFWNGLFSVKAGSEDKKAVEELVRFVFFKIEKGKPSNESLVKYHKILEDTFKEKTTLDEKTFTNLIQSYIVFIKIVWKAMDSGAPSLIYKAAQVNRNIVSRLYTAYTKAFGINVKHIKEFCFQELYAPSEVISIPALLKRPDQKVYKLINKL